MPTSRAYRTKTASPLAMHRRWIQQDMDLQDADIMRAYDRAQYYAHEDGCHTGTLGAQDAPLNPYNLRVPNQRNPTNDHPQTP